MASNIEVVPGGPSFHLFTFRKGTKILSVTDHVHRRMKLFCVKTKVIGYAIFEVGRSKKERRKKKKKMEKSGSIAVYW